MEEILPDCHPGRILSQEIPWQVVANIYSKVTNYPCKEVQPYPEREENTEQWGKQEQHSSIEDAAINDAGNLFAYPIRCPIPT